jgi:hypothetical protein
MVAPAGAGAGKGGEDSRGEEEPDVKTRYLQLRNKVFSFVKDRHEFPAGLEETTLGDGVSDGLRDGDHEMDHEGPGGIAQDEDSIPAEFSKEGVEEFIRHLRSHPACLAQLSALVASAASAGSTAVNPSTSMHLQRSSPELQRMSRTLWNNFLADEEGKDSQEQSLPIMLAKLHGTTDLQTAGAEVILRMLWQILAETFSPEVMQTSQKLLKILKDTVLSHEYTMTSDFNALVDVRPFLVKVVESNLKLEDIRAMQMARCRLAYELLNEVVAISMDRASKHRALVTISQSWVSRFPKLFGGACNLHRYEQPGD